MRKVLLLIASLFLLTIFGWARHEDFYNRVVSDQAEQCQAEMSTIGLEPAMLAGNNMITDGQRAGVQAAQPSRTDFYNAVLIDQVEGFKAENEANWSGPTLLAGNNMITGRQAGRSRPDFYNRVLSAKVQELQSENNAIGEGPTLLAGNNMVTGEVVVFTPEAATPEDFYNQVLSAQVVEYGIDNNAIAPSNLEFAESQSSSSIVPGSMASNAGGGSSERDWFSSTCAVQAELNRRLKKSQSPNGW